MRKLLLIALLSSQIFKILYCQSIYPKIDFRSPVDTALALAGNFGEIRSNHFHAGFDIRTNNKEGMPIYAVADGYVSRIKISPYGYGKAIYITHPNGYTSVYAHLQSFNTVIQAYVKNIQYAKQTFAIDTLIAPQVLPIKKSDFIALSGNTGGSQGPHLHFEIRDTKTEFPINPYYFGFVVDDTIKPRIVQLAVYPMDEMATINGKNAIKKIAPLYKKGSYSYAPKDTLTVSGKIAFGIQCYDTETNSTNQNGVFSIELQSGGKRIYYHELEKFSFENSRYVNAHIDYADKQKNKTQIQKCFLSKNNQIGIYKDLLNNGIVTFNDTAVHWMKFIVKDFYGNTTELMLKVKSRLPVSINAKSKSAAPVFDCFKENSFSDKEIKLTIPVNALYDDINFNYLKMPTIKGAYSNTYKVMSAEIALHKSYSLAIKTNQLPDSLQNKACIVSLSEKGKQTYEGGSYQNGWLTTNTKNFGLFTVTIDTIAPKLKVLKLKKDIPIDLSKAKQITVIATDNLSGIKNYNATIDGKWVLCEYETKGDFLFYTFDENIEKGKHVFQIEVEDQKENKRVLAFEFIR